MIRLDSYPTDQLAAEGGTPAAFSVPPTLSCLLHGAGLPPSQSLAVVVGGVRQEVMRYDGLEVCSWQCSQGTLMEIYLMRGARVRKAWRGRWDGTRTIAHTGRVWLQVFCAGIRQPAGLALPPSSVPAPIHPALAAAAQNGTAVTGRTPATSPPISSGPPLARPALTSGGEAEVCEERRDEREEEDLRREARSETASLPGDETEEEQGDAWEETEEETENGEDLQERAGLPSPTLVRPTLPPAAAPTPLAVPDGTMVATMHAASVWSRPDHARVLQQLADRLADMPANTILVDLRQHPPTPRARLSRFQPRSTPARPARPEKLGLTKEVLRLLYGARYWDRGREIATSRQMLAGRPSRWRRVVDPLTSSEGLSMLLQALEQGCSLLILDDLPVYEESARAAVLAALRERTTNLALGLCS